MREMKIQGFITIIVCWMLLSLFALNLVSAGKYIANINFYTARDGEEEEFHLGDTIILKAWKTVTGAFNVEYTFIYPDGRRLGPRFYPLVGTGEFVIDKWTITGNDPTGTYQIRVRVFDTITGDMLGDDYLIFFVRERSIIESILKPEILTAIAIVAVVAIVGVVLITRKPKEVVTPPIMPTGGPETVVVKAPGTVVMTRPTGETMTYIAGFRVGERMIPIRSLPQIFGREDFQGFIPEEALTFITRREKGGHFEVRYDYSRGRFIIEDVRSTNGTLLNGEEIKGKGPQELKDGDIVSPAGTVNLRFTVKVA
ncbi:MAG: FHA domain-containing protein [candidate division WOR-3 bacterium]